MSHQLDIDVDLLSSSIGSLVKGVTGPKVVVSVVASTTGFRMGFYIETLGIPFYPLLAGDKVARSGRFEEAVRLYGRRGGEEGKQECRQTDWDGHGARGWFACVIFDTLVVRGSLL
jgi:hypothetical protein